jgi:small conductance mechanosensitive channel
MDQSSAQELIDSVVGLVSQWGLQVIGAIAVLIIGRWVAGKLKSGVAKALERGSVDATLIPFLSGLVYYAALAVVLIAVLGLFGIETTSLVAVLATAGLAVGLALQGTLSNFSSGVMLLLFRPFKVGNVVTAGGETGSVVEIGIFSTILKTPDNIQIIVPNSAIFGGTIKNVSAYDTRRNDFVIGVSYDDDLAAVESVLQKICASDDRILAEPAVTIAVAELADSSVNFVVRPWCAASDYWPLRFDLTRRFKEELEAAGCSIPYPQSDVHVIQQATDNAA